MGKLMHGARDRVSSWLATGLLAAGLASATAPAAAIGVSFSPFAQTVFSGAVAQVDIIVSDFMPGGLGSYDFTINYDSSVLALAGVVDGGVVSPFSPSSFFGWVDNAGSLEISDFSLDDPVALLAAQAGRLGVGSTWVTLFSLRFNTIGVGDSLLNFNGGTLSDVDGLIVGFDSDNGSITVLENLAVPVPGTLSLAMAALAAGAVVRRRKA